MVKSRLLERYRTLFGNEFKEFMEVIKSPPVDSIRVNTLKVDNRELENELSKKGWKLERFEWYDCGFWVHEPKYKLGATLEFSLGYYYVQEAASMIPPLVLDPRPGEIVLDMCAAPGSKTTQIAQLMENKGIIIANDVSLERLVALGANVQRCGVANVIATQMDGTKFWMLRQKFDRVLVDVPCSGSGTLRSNPNIWKELSMGMISRLTKLQKSLILSGFDSLKRNGILVYSTCSLEPEENEEVVDFLLKKRKNARVERIEIPGLKFNDGLTTWEGKDFDASLAECMRIHPQDNLTDGFFIARVRKHD